MADSVSTRPTRRRVRGTRAVFVGPASVAAVLLIGACGGSGPNVNSGSAGLCLPTARVAIAAFLKTSPAGVTTSRSVGNNSYPQCMFSVRLVDGARVETMVNIDNGPQPYFILERTEVEDAQVFTATPQHAPPLAVMGLGLEADWFPQYPYLMSTDGYRLLTVTVTWAHQRQARLLALAEAASRPYLHTPHGKAATRLATSYP